VDFNGVTLIGDATKPSGFVAKLDPINGVRVH